MPDVVFVYKRPQVNCTALSANAAHSAGVLNKHGVTAATATLDGIRSWDKWIEENAPRVIVLSAFILKPFDLDALARKYRHVTFLQRCHTNLAWLFQSRDDYHSAFETLNVAAQRSNVVYSLVCEREASAWSAAGVRVVCVPNVWSGGFAASGRGSLRDPNTVNLSAIFAIRLLKDPAGHVLAAANVNAYTPARLHMQLERFDSPVYVEQIKRAAMLTRCPFSAQPYRDHDDHLRWLDETVDIGLQLSLTESFNYVALEHLALGIPCVTSRAVEFSPWRVNAEDYQGAAAVILDQIIPNYASASEAAIHAAREVSARNEALFVDTFQSLLHKE